MSPTGKPNKPKTRQYKTFYELEEEETVKKEEEEAHKRVSLEASMRFWAWTEYIPTPKRIKKVLFPPDWVKVTILRFSSDPLGTRINETFKSMHVYTRAEKKQWLKLWCDMDKALSNRVSFRTLMLYFHLTEDTWSRRVYDVMNDNLNGSLQFEEFLSFCAAYCYIDKHKTVEFSFRLISRRGATFKPTVSVLDLEDMRQFVRFRFKMKEPVAIQKRALDVINYLDTDGDGSIYLDEYERFTKRNPVFVRFTHLWQQHMRKCIFGIKYWVDKSRHMKADRAKGLDNMTLLFRMNLDSENFTNIDLLDPVVDERGRAVITPAYIPPTIFANKPSVATTTSDADSLGSFERTPPPSATAAVKLPPLPPTLPLNTSMLAWHGPLANALNLTMIKKYSEEFAEVYILKLEKKLTRKAKKAKDSELARAVASHTYKRLVGVCEDIIYGRKWLRLAFNHWIESVGLERHATPTALKAADEARLVARKRMANLITKESVKEISLRGDTFSPENIARKLEEEQKAKEAAMFGPKDGLSAIAAKLEEEGNMIDDMHIRIVENCRKQEEIMDDPDDQCAIYVRERFMRDHIAGLDQYRHERISKFVQDRRDCEVPRDVRALLLQPRLGPLHNYKMRLPYAESESEESDVEI